jgi:hypothetical protein
MVKHTCRQKLFFLANKFCEHATRAQCWRAGVLDVCYSHCVPVKVPIVFPSNSQRLSHVFSKFLTCSPKTFPIANHFLSNIVFWP